MAKSRFYVGLPVFNGENYLAEAVESILSQTFGDFELIISDNASTDGTEEICRDFARRDTRVRYYRNESNCGAAWNFNRVFELSDGEYFMWAAHDDKYTPDYVKSCIEILDQDPKVVLCYTRAIDIDEHGNQIKKKDHTNNSDSDIPHKRFKKLIDLSYTCEAMFGVIRSDVLKKTNLHGSYADSDRVLLSEIGLYGRFHLIPEYLFLHREHPLRSIRKFPARHQRTAWFNPKNTGKIVFPHFREFAEFIRGVRRSPVASRERWCCYGHLGRWLIGNRKRFIWDIKGAVKQLRGQS